MFQLLLYFNTKLGSRAAAKTCMQRYPSDVRAGLGRAEGLSHGQMVASQAGIGNVRVGESAMKFFGGRPSDSLTWKWKIDCWTLYK